LCADFLVLTARRDSGQFLLARIWFSAGLTSRFPNLGCAIKNSPKLGLLPGHTMSVRPVVDQKRGCKMASGTVKFFNTQKGFGFIQPSDGGKDVFVHISAVQRAGLTTLMEGQKVSYELLTERGKTAAGNLRVD
jgi:cold shock protein